MITKTKKCEKGLRNDNPNRYGGKIKQIGHAERSKKLNLDFLGLSTMHREFLNKYTNTKRSPGEYRKV